MQVRCCQSHVPPSAAAAAPRAHAHLYALGQMRAGAAREQLPAPAPAAAGLTDVHSAGPVSASAVGAAASWRSQVGDALAGAAAGVMTCTKSASTWWQGHGERG